MLPEAPPRVNGVAVVSGLRQGKCAEDREVRRREGPASPAGP